MGNNVGIWLDSSRAIIVSLADGEAHVKEIDSNLEAYQRKRGYHGGTPYMVQDVGSETNEQERRRHQMKYYFDAIIDDIKNANAIMIFGPAGAKLEFEKELHRHNDLIPKLKAVETADKMTNNQVIAHVKEFYSKNGVAK